MLVYYDIINMKNTNLIGYSYFISINGVNMNLKQLNYFLMIAEEKNISSAAIKLHMCQPPLSTQLKLLEEEIGVKLFSRTTRSLEITEAGKLLQKRSLQIFELLDTTKKELSQLKSGYQDTLRIGFVASSVAVLLPEKLTDFHSKHPEITFQMREGNTYRILDLLQSGIIDFGLVRTPFNTEAFNVIYLKEEPMIAVYKDQSIFKASLELIELNKLPLVLDKRFSTLITDACHKAGFHPNIICEGEDSRSILSWASASIGIAILPLSGKNLINDNTLSYSVINDSSLETQSAIVTLKKEAISYLTKELIEILK